MLFVSYSFVVFFLVIFSIYHLVKGVKIQNFIVFSSSCVFYAWWSWKFLLLMLGLSITGYVAARIMNGKAATRRLVILWCAVGIALGCLGFFKYSYFIYKTGLSLAEWLGFSPSHIEFSIVLPIAISFHTFQLIAYIVDVYRFDQKPERNLLDFMAFSFFFPQLLAGPIERARHLLSQFKHPRSMSRELIDKGLFLISYGYFVKLALADNAGAIVDSVFVNYQVSGWSIFFGTILFGFQIYYDFMGYSLIAKGTAALLGFDLVWNFNLPYWSISPQDFWHRWHISLSRWLRDYLYIPLGGNRSSTLATLRNLFITMTLGGLWHGASWNFVLWGAWHGLVLVVHRVLFAKDDSHLGALGKLVGWLYTMCCVFIGWLFFRVSTLDVYKATMRSLGNWEWMPVHTAQLRSVLFICGVLLTCEYFQRRSNDLLVFANRGGLLLKGTVIGIFAFLAFSFIIKTKYSFIYFAF